MSSQAVLESKWPSENTHAQLCWSRLRNVIIAVSQFRRVLRQRQLSAYSNSENDFDRISTDSFLDEFGVVDKTDGETREAAHTEPPNSEEKSSTGADCPKCTTCSLRSPSECVCCLHLTLIVPLRVVSVKCLFGLTLVM